MRAPRTAAALCALALGTTAARASLGSLECGFVATGRATVVSSPVPLFSAADVFRDRTEFGPPKHRGGDYHQFLESLDVNPEAAAPQYADLNYTLRAHHLLQWQFTIHGGPTGGGSSFAAQTRGDGDVVASCLVTDRFDGSYDVACAPTRDGRARITVDLMHVQFGAFTPYGPRLEVQEQIKAPLFDCTYTSVHVLTTETVCKATALDRQGGRWLDARSEAPTHESTDGCSASAPMPRMAECVASFPHVHMVGESHMRFFYDYLLQVMGRPNKNLEVKHSDDSSGNLHYHAAHYIVQGPEGGVIMNALRGINFTSGSLLMVSFGSWHLHGMGLAKSVALVRDVLAPELERLMATHNLRVVVTTAPAKFKQEGAWAGIENTASVAALQEATEMSMPAGVRVVDMVHATRGFMESVRPPIDWDCDHDGQCSCHILCRHGGSDVYGRFGKQVFWRIWEAACMS